MTLHRNMIRNHSQLERESNDRWSVSGWIRTTTKNKRARRKEGKNVMNISFHFLFRLRGDFIKIIKKKRTIFDSQIRPDVCVRGRQDKEFSFFGWLEEGGLTRRRRRILHLLKLVTILRSMNHIRSMRSVPWTNHSLSTSVFNIFSCTSSFLHLSLSLSFFPFFFVRLHVVSALLTCLFCV